MYTGIDIGGTKCAVVLSDDNGNILKKERFPTVGFEETLAKIIDTTERVGVGKAIGISCGGPLDSERGVIMSPPNLPGWDDVHIADILGQRFGVPVGLCNDADAGALVEEYIELYRSLQRRRRLCACRMEVRRGKRHEEHDIHDLRNRSRSGADTER